MRRLDRIFKQISIGEKLVSRESREES